MAAPGPILRRSLETLHAGHSVWGVEVMGSKASNSCPHSSQM